MQNLKMNTFARDILLSFVNSAVQFVDISIVVDADVGEALAFVQDLLEAEADAIKNREPHATASIGRLNEAAYEVFSISNEIDAGEFDDGK